MMRKRNLLKVILVGLIILAVGSTWYINTFLAPRKLKDFFIKNISQSINRPISLESVHFNLINGFILNNLTIYEPDQKTVFIQVKRFSTKLFFIPLLKEKKILIPSIYITSPLITITKNQDNTWNFSNPELLRKASVSKKPEKAGFSILVQSIKVENGQINFLDNTRSPAYSRQLHYLNGDVAFSIKDAVQFKATSQLDTPQKTGIALDGSYDLKTGLVSVKGILKNLSLIEPYNYFYKTSLFVDLKGGMADATFDLKIYKDKKFSLDVDTAIKNLYLSYSGLTLKGDMNIASTSVCDFRENFKGACSVGLSLKGASLSGIYLVNELSNLNGKVTISNKGLYCEYLWGEAYGIPIKFSGEIKDFKKPLLQAEIQADMDLSNYKNFLDQDLKTKFKDVDLQGPAEVTIKLSDNLKDSQPPSIGGNIKLKGVTLKAPLIPDKLEKLAGNISFQNDIIYLLRLSFDYGTQENVLDAKIKGLKIPDVLVKFKNKEILLNSRFRAGQNNIHILRASGSYLNSLFDFDGDIKDFANPNVSMHGNLAVNLLDLRKALPKAAGMLTRFDVKGICNLDALLNGPLKEPAGMEITVKGQSDRISVWDLKCDDVKLNLRIKDKNFAIPEFSAKPYGGTLLAAMEMDLTQHNPPYSINLAMENVDLSKFILDTNLKDRQMSGKASAKLAIRGYGKNLETMKGEGTIIIKGGYLWEMPLLRGVADLLFLPNLSSIIFDEASADFLITNKTISTANLALHSQNVGFAGEGSVTFGGDLDFSITTTISEGFIKGSSEFAKLATSLLAEAGQFIGTIRIGGTIKNPAYKFIPLPVTKILKDKVKKLIGGIF